MVEKLFWSGGWDSTYTLIQELKKGKTIRPIYIKVEKRITTEREIEAIDKVRNRLLEYPEFKDKICPVLFLDEKNIPILQEIVDARNNLYVRYQIGLQYILLASYAETNPGILLGLEKAVTKGAGITQSLRNEAVFVIEDDGIKSLDASKTDPDVALLFQNIRFPILDVTEVEMKNKLEEWGLLSIMDDVWFCYEPVNGEPCGLCPPCRQKIECGMEYLLPFSSVIRYRIKKSFHSKL